MTADESNQFNYQNFNNALWDSSITWTGSGWDMFTLWKAFGNVTFTEPAIGDFDVTNPSNEIAIANGMGSSALIREAVIEVYGSDRTWAKDTIFDISRISCSVAIGNVNKHRMLNQEIVLTGEQRVFETKQILPVKDVGIKKIIAPAGNIDSGAVIAPACSVYNFGNLPVSYSVRMRIGNFYNSVALVTGHYPGTAVYLNNFAGWTPYQTGFHVVSCSTELAGDDSTGNDRKMDTMFVWIRDVGTEMILNPVSGAVFSPGTNITPLARLRNFGNVTETFTAQFKLIGPTDYSDIQTINRLSAGNYIDQKFGQSTYLAAGFYTISCSTGLAGEMHIENDQQMQTFLVMSEPILLYPTTYGLINDKTPIFDWVDLDGADYFSIQVDNDSNFSSPEFENNNVIGSQIELTMPISDDCYFWRIRGGTNGLWGPWSEVWQFELDVTAPNTLVLVKPDSAATDVDINPVFARTEVSLLPVLLLPKEKMK